MKPWRRLARPMAAGLLRRTKGAPDAHTDIARTADRRWLRCCRTLGNWGGRMGDQPVAGAPDLLRVSGNDYRTGNTVLPGSATGETQRWTSPAGGCYWHRDARCGAGARSRTALDCGSRGVLFRVVQRYCVRNRAPAPGAALCAVSAIHALPATCRQSPSPYTTRPPTAPCKAPAIPLALPVPGSLRIPLSVIATRFYHTPDSSVPLPVLSCWFLVLSSWFSVLSSWFSVLGSRFSVLTIHYPNFWYPIP